jgi:regulatory protein
LRHLARYAATAAGLTRVLDRRIARWAAAPQDTERAETEAAAAAARAAARLVVARLVEAGAIDDAGFAAARAARLARSGRSRRAVAANLAARGIDADTAQAALAGTPDELGAALVHARRRRIGPVRAGTADIDADARRRELGMLARAGFPHDVASRALAMPPEEAQAMVMRLPR